MGDSAEKSPLLGKERREERFCHKNVPLWVLFVTIFACAVIGFLTCLVVFYSTKSNNVENFVPVAKTKSFNGGKTSRGRGCTIGKEKRGEYRMSKRMWEEKNYESKLAKTWNWCDRDGVSYCSVMKNQHIPVYCGSCWAHGATNAIADRFNIHAHNNRWTQHTFSVQEVIDCSGSGCGGGTAETVYRHAMSKGLVDETCNVYQARDGPCTKFNRCGTCFHKDVCNSLTNYTIFKVKEFGTLIGREQMMAEIQHGGPISCGMAVTDYFDMNYTGGVYKEKSDLEIDHIVEVVGWGIEKGVEHWIVKNSWGTPWGEKGFFKIVTSKYSDENGTGNDYNMKIETDCSYVIPDIKLYYPK